MPAYGKRGKTVWFFRAAKKEMRSASPRRRTSREDGAPQQLIERAWYSTALDYATEAKPSAIVREEAS
jgi:hypothetical protein